jgi:hypothetical protein
MGKTFGIARGIKNRPWLVLVLLLVTIADARLTVSLNFGWRTTNHANNGCNFAVPLNNKQCGGLRNVMPIADASACAAAACKANLNVWQYLNGSVSQGEGCWIGGKCEETKQYKTGWLGGGNPSGPPAANSSEATTGYDDSAWQVIDIPHDATVTGEYSSHANGGEGYLPPVKSWYRKHFAVPSNWEEKAITLVVDAALSTTTWWLNGKQLAVQNPAGYLPYIVRLDTNGLAIGSSENVLTAYVDGGITTGWWYEGSGE